MTLADYSNWGAYERSCETPEEASPSDAKEVHNAQEAYRECMEAIAAILHKRGLSNFEPSDPNWVVLFGDVEDVIKESSKVAFSNLEDKGFDLSVSGENHPQFKEKVYRIVREGKAA